METDRIYIAQKVIVPFYLIVVTLEKLINVIYRNETRHCFGQVITGI